MTDEQIKDIFEQQMEKKANKFAELRQKATEGKWPRNVVGHEAFNGYVVGYTEAIEDLERMKLNGNCPNCGTPHYLSPIGNDGINCELCQSEE